MGWIGIVLAIIAVYLAFKVVGFLFKLAMWGLVLVCLYWFAAPYLGMPLPAF
mgnify:CR=1 FL=1